MVFRDFSDAEIAESAERRAIQRYNVRIMHARCPHCHNPIELVDDTSYSDVVCPSCGTSFSLIADATVSYRQGANETIGRFELLERVGLGAFGAVWKAHDAELDRTVAVKIPRQNQLDTAESEQFLREARAAAQLTHPGIVAVHEIGREGDTVYIISDFVQGISLASRLTAGPTTVREAAEVCAKIADALHHAHEAGVVHRDIKPSNIMLDDDGEPHVTDFGLAKRNAGEITMTADGKVLGTPAYMSPEQARGEAHAADARSDVYSLGAVLFHLLTGGSPFRGDTRMLLHQVIHDDPPSPRQLNGNVPRDLETICLKCLRKESDRRYDSANGLAADLRHWLNGEPIKARPVSRIERTWLWCRRRPAISGAMLAILLTAGIVAGFLVVASHRNLVQRVETAVSSLNTTRGVIVPSLDYLDGFPSEMMQAELRRQFESADETRLLPLAYALAHFGDIRIGFLVSRVELASPDEVDNLVAALSHSRTDATAALAQAAATAESQESWQHRARLALLALRLNAAELAQQMCQLRADPIQRTWFIEESSTWHGDLSQLVRVVSDSDDAEVRSAVALAVGSAPQLDVSRADRQAWESVLAQWYHNEPDPLTHSAAGWTLRQLKLTVPELPSSGYPAKGREWYVNNLAMTMLRVPAGSFIRKDSTVGDESMEQQVTLTRSFLMCDREVSRAQFQHFVRDNPEVEELQAWQGADIDFSPSERHPVQQVSWHHAVLFCNWLSDKEGLNACYERAGEDALAGDNWRAIPDSDGYRLPTEAEWEWACRAGSATQYCFGDDTSLIDRYAVCRSDRTEIPGSKLPNGWGLFDVHGNVWEWCQDWAGPFGEEAAVSDPTGPRQGTSRVLRGGAFGNLGQYLGSPYRNVNSADSRYFSFGFRVARTYP